MSTEAGNYAKVQLWEWAFGILGLGCLAALLWRVGLQQPITLEVLFVHLLYLGSVEWCRRRSQSVGWQRCRLVTAYLYALWFFGSVAKISPALYHSFYDAHLLGIDRWMFGETPSALWRGSYGLTQLMSAAYLSYLLYLHAALAFWLFQPLSQARRFWTYLFVAYAVGYTGYLLVPAMGPGVAFPSLFPAPIVGQEGWIASLNSYVVSGGSAVYDVFPSLHVLITCVVLDFERRTVPQRFWVMLPVALFLFASTVYLRYHYAIDLVAGFVCFGLLLVWFQNWDGENR